MEPIIPPKKWHVLLAGFAAERAADGITLWLAEKDSLVAVANPLEPQMVGLRQPIRFGLVSQVYLTGQAMLEESPATNPRHDATIDRRIGKSCAVIMAVPVNLPGGDGVISAVRHEGAAAAFTLDDLAALVRLAVDFGRPDL